MPTRDGPTSDATATGDPTRDTTRTANTEGGAANGAAPEGVNFNYRIRDEDSFDAATREPRQIAGLYFYLQLDFLVECAYRVGQDFFRRSHLYSALKEKTPAGQRTIAPDLARLRARCGSDERIPSQEQRDDIFLPVFGQSSSGAVNGEADFPRLRDGLIEAAAAFAERAFNDGVEMLREAVRSSHVPFKDYLTSVQGDSLVWSTDDALSGVARELAYPILRNRGVRAVFSINAPPEPQWPFIEDSNANKLIEEIGKQLLMPTDPQPAITRQVVSNRQRAALRGAEAIATILDFSAHDTDEDLDLLITKCYTWGSALKSLAMWPNNQMASEPAGRSMYGD
jgi:hypothetical protein